ncbi:hypothetical protein ACHAWO_003248 [Cyclotella atomus]|uniref:Uncharacterized protein n=1 Tax=Cyclotella atomus TaxID=382360 RepID=A0ABD3Q6T4_9STRA
MEPSESNDIASPKRVEGGADLIVKKKRKRTQQSCTSNNAASSNVPSILSSIPDSSRALLSETHAKTKSAAAADEFGDDSLLLASLPNDTLMRLRAQTRPTNGMATEACAYCPIFTVSKQEDDSSKKNSTHAAPFLPQQVLLYLSSNHAQTNEDIKQLAAANTIRLLQLHGTAIARNGLGWRGDGNDDEDVAVMETCAYKTAARMALDAHFGCDTQAESTYLWFTSVLLPSFCGKTWILSSSLESFIEDAAAAAPPVLSTNSDITNKNTSGQRWTAIQMNSMVKELSHAGLLLPKRGLGLNGGESYWFSLPGLGKAAKSIMDGRLSILRRIQSSKFKEKKRSTLEREIGRPDSKMKDSNTYVQSGMFLVLDLLAKGMVHIHSTCTGDQYVRIN